MVPADSRLQGANRRAFLGFYLIGGLLVLPGCTLTAWGYHLNPPYPAIAIHFLSFLAGILLALRLSYFLLARFGAHRLLLGSLIVAATGNILVEFSAPPASNLSRHLSLALVGTAQGGLMAATLQMLRRLYEREPAATVNLAGGLIGLGAFSTALLGALSYSWTEFKGLFALLALLPFAAAAWIFRQGIPPDSDIVDLGFREVLKESRSPVHILFAALLFFETAAEVSLLEWISLHLILGAGMSPAAAMYFLAFYCVLLLAGRFVAQAILDRFPHRRLLLSSAAMSWLGILFFASTSNFFGAALGLTLSAFGFSFVYPLLVERIGSRFREYHASMFHGIFGLGMLGGFLAPAIIALLADYSSAAYAMTVPLACSLIVFLLLVILWIESKISGSRVVRN